MEDPSLAEGASESEDELPVQGVASNIAPPKDYRPPGFSSWLPFGSYACETHGTEKCDLLHAQKPAKDRDMGRESQREEKKEREETGRSTGNTGGLMGQRGASNAEMLNAAHFNSSQELRKLESLLLSLSEQAKQCRFLIETAQRRLANQGGFYSHEILKQAAANELTYEAQLVEILDKIGKVHEKINAFSGMDGFQIIGVIPSPPSASDSTDNAPQSQPATSSAPKGKGKAKK